MEVERSLRVLDGAVLVLCAVGGVQSQSMTVDRQMKRYHVPRLAFINKLDRIGANPKRVCQELRDKLGADAIPMQLPIGVGEKLEGIIDLVKLKAAYFDGRDGERVRFEEIPAAMKDEVAEARHHMLEQLAMYSDVLMEKLLGEEEISEDLIHDVVRQAVLHRDATPVFMGSAYKNKGVQLLLDAVVRYLPSPLDRDIQAKKWDDPTQTFKLEPDPKKPFIGMAFKIMDDPFGQLTFMRIYQGSIKKGETYVNQRTTRTERFSRIVKMHADKREEIDLAEAGDIVAIMGIDAASGDTYAGEQKYGTLESMFVPEPVIKVSVTPSSRADSDKLAKALQRFRKEDPTFRVFNDEETAEILIAGMGELHLEIYVERIRREYKVELEVGPPKVSYREAPTKIAEFNYKHKKQTGGSGQYAHVVGKIEPLPEDNPTPYEFDNAVFGGRIPKEYIAPVDKGFQRALVKGPLCECEVVGVKAILEDGSYHDVDSSEMAFNICGFDCMRETLRKAGMVLLEPIMNLEVEAPSEFQGSITGHLSSKRGMITSSETLGGNVVLRAEVPLSSMFDYANELRSMTQGKGGFTMEFHKYKPVPKNLQDEIVEKRRKEIEEEKKK